MDAAERAAACIAHPGVDACPEDLETLPERFVDENRLWGLLAHRGIEVDDKDTLDRQQALFDELADLLDQFESTNAEILLIKYPDLAKRHRDLDLLVPSGIETVHRILIENGYHVTGDGEPYKRGYGREVGEYSIELDVHEAITWWGNVYLDADRLWSGRTERTLYRTTVPVPNPTDELLICAANAAFGEFRLNLFDVLTTWWLITQGADVENARELARNQNWPTQFDYVCGLMERVHEQLFETSLEPGILAAGPDPIPELPYRYPITSIIGLRFRKTVTDLRADGMEAALGSGRGYVLELLQIAFDYFFYRTGLPKHNVFNMRSFLGQSKQ